MSSSGGSSGGKQSKGFLDQVANVVNPVIETMYGYNPATGDFDYFQNSWVGELTGRKRAAEANKRAQVGIDEEKRARARDAELEWIDNYRRDMAGSTQAQGIRNSADARARMVGSTAATGETMGGSSEELLGV